MGYNDLETVHYEAIIARRALEDLAAALEQLPLEVRADVTHGLSAGINEAGVDAAVATSQQILVSLGEWLEKIAAAAETKENDDG